MTPLFKKLNFKDHAEILVINAPASFKQEVDAMTDFTKIKKDPQKASKIEFALIFVLTQEQIDRAIAAIFPKLQGDAIVWFCYPKGTSKKYTCDFNRDTGWAALGNFNFEAVRQVAIDEDWSALRFRKTDYIKTLKRRENYAISKAGKARIRKNDKS